MKRVYTARNLIEAQLLKDYLQSAGIEVYLQGEALTGAIGELPADVTPSLWLRSDRDEPLAKKLIASFNQPREQDLPFHDPWQCPQCGEAIEAQFSQCWRCGQQRLV